jgi:membrane protein DedA with SNARE-associated domain
VSPTESLEWLERYSVIILPALVVTEQVGLPLPAVPALLAVGALTAKGRVSLLPVIGAIAVVALAVDLVWHELGRRRGARVLSGLCRLSLEPDVCVRRTENIFLRHGIRALLVAKFLPGLTTVMPPLAGVFGVPRLRFAIYDVAGVLLWAGLWSGIGYVFSEAIEEVARRVADLGRDVGLLAASVLVGYVLLKVVRRQLFLRSLRVARISPEELKQKLEAGEEDLVILDLRTALDVAAAPYAIPGSRWITAEALDEHASEIPRDRELVLYCS